MLTYLINMYIINDLSIDNQLTNIVTIKQHYSIITISIISWVDNPWGNDIRLCVTKRLLD